MYVCVFSFTCYNELPYLYRRSGSAIGNAFGEGSGEIWLDNVQCQGSENALQDCPSNAWGDENCGHYEDISITCNTNSTNPIIGKLEQWFKCKIGEGELYL